jgi:hypothetical protein
VSPSAINGARSQSVRWPWPFKAGARKKINRHQKARERWQSFQNVGENDRSRSVILNGAIDCKRHEFRMGLEGKAGLAQTRAMVLELLRRRIDAHLHGEGTKSRSRRGNISGANGKGQTQNAVRHRERGKGAGVQLREHGFA